MERERMGSAALKPSKHKPHAVCIPYPAQGHINPMLQLAKLLHHSGFHVTFVNTEFNHARLLKSRAPHPPSAVSSFCFRTIPDGLPPTDADSTQDIASLSDSTSKNCLAPFRALLSELNGSSSADVPPVTCIVSDGAMSFTLTAAEELGIPEVLFWTASACGFMGYAHYSLLREKGFLPLKDISYLTDGYLDTIIDSIPGMKGVRLRDIPSFIITTNPDDVMVNFIMNEIERAQKASAIILNTFDALEHNVLNALSSMFPPVCAIGPLQLQFTQISDNKLNFIGSNLWKEDRSCLEWLDSREASSVVYVNFGSITIMTNNQLMEFARGLANSNQSFLWIIRPNLVDGDLAIIPPEFFAKTKERSFIASWCPQEQVLHHPAVGGFLTHCGWNSVIESMCGGVPMICWPFFAEQPTNCRFCCTEWGIGMEICNDVKRDEVERLVRELMEGERGKEMKKKTMEWKEKAEEATRRLSGSSFLNLERIIKSFLLPRDSS
ncbi:7-deoxyloganetin glucosyltransferase-like isoform X1 [Malania oleifera]|uniref:7-deoxyloganetin glucosyltransferase-like isoform X1 n=1 Tax=Malania oleifera TaxID=397392 RepID=UPI0025AE77DE|nr:7-deoxyloganetin glucosyltransferase-like isoform X1 [Malania oleifera]